MARRGWGGSPPADDKEARRRIVEAAMRCVDRRGPKTTLADVAAELSVIRQTVYRYFPGTDQLFAAVGLVAVEKFVDDLAEHLQPLTDPADWVVEALATVIERLPDERHLTLLLAAGRTAPFAQTMTSDASRRVNRSLLNRSSVDWGAAGLGDDEIDGLLEVMVRLVQSMVVDPPDPPRAGPELRRFLRRWVAPAVDPSAVLTA